MIEDCLVVEFAVEGDGCPLAEATGALGIAVRSHLPVARGDGTTLLRATARERGQAFVAHLDADDRIDFLHASEADAGTVVRCLSRRPCVVHDLVAAGLLLESLEYRHGRGHFVGSVVGHEVLRTVLEATQDAVGVDLERVYPLEASESDRLVRKWDITPAQEEAFRTAFRMGYLSVPRDVTAAAVADELGIGKSAFLERLRRGEQRLVGQLFE
jgi:predicted DNA binding protein